MGYTYSRSVWRGLVMVVSVPENSKRVTPVFGLVLVHVQYMYNAFMYCMCTVCACTCTR